MQNSSKNDRSAFPAPVYRETVLAPIFEEARRYFLDPLIEIEFAHTLMLARQGIMPRDEAASCITALRSLDLNAIRHTSYDSSVEDLFFYIERLLAEACGSEIAGKMHTARSRNDIDITMYRMLLRDRLLQFADANRELRACLLRLANEHVSSLMPGYTHNQPAQPTTLAHYLMAYVEILERDAERVQEAFVRVNRNSLGACAITTTGFPIDRTYTASLLGFPALQMNSYGAIAAVDYLAESCSVLATSMLSLGRFVQDLLLWSTAEFGYLRLSDAYVQISSIMPQKRNPVPLEHVRILGSRALMQGQAIIGCLHNTPFADMNDAEDQIQPLVYSAFHDAHRALTLLTGVLDQATFNTGRMASAADAHFLPVTELADTLVRTTGMSFHAAHTIVSRAVRQLNGVYAPESMSRMVERELASLSDVRPAISRDQILTALSAANFVAVRRIPGGPAQEVIEPEIQRAQSQLAADRAWSRGTAEQLANARAVLQQQCDELLRQTELG